MQPTRRSYSKSFKAQIIQECVQPGASIASIALSHSLNANLVHKWIRVHTQQNTALQQTCSPKYCSRCKTNLMKASLLIPTIPQAWRYAGSFEPNMPVSPTLTHRAAVNELP
ncbi:transposase [Pseudomonas sp. ICMP 8385]|uniref:transposase n=1 Tax=Pseudomonas sp. ICMP 8385 TaxID=1718920 RepID=UPI001C54CD3E|nr:transposase [Pseudomonas sp. ICMP 8385]